MKNTQIGRIEMAFMDTSIEQREGSPYIGYWLGIIEQRKAVKSCEIFQDCA